MKAEKGHRNREQLDGDEEGQQQTCSARHQRELIVEQGVKIRQQLAQDAQDPADTRVLPGLELPGQRKHRADHHATTIAHQAQSQQLAPIQRQQRRAQIRGFGLRLFRAQHGLDLLGGGERDHVHHRLGLVATRRLQAQLGNAEGAVQQIAAAHDVLDARVRNVPLGAGKDAFLDQQFVVAEPVAKADAVDQGVQRVADGADDDEQLPPLATAEENQHQQRHDQRPQLDQQGKQPGQRVQTQHRRGSCIRDDLRLRIRRRHGHRVRASGRAATTHRRAPALRPPVPPSECPRCRP